MICSNTQKKLDSSFYCVLKDKRVEDILLKDILEKAKISKSTFYSNYENVDDYIKDRINNFFHPIYCDVNLYKSIPGASSCIFISIADILYDNRLFVKRIFDSKYKELLLNNIDFIFEERLNFCFAHNRFATDNNKKAVFLSYGFKGLIEKFVETDDDSYLKESAGILQDTIESYASMKTGAKR